MKLLTTEFEQVFGLSIHKIYNVPLSE